MNVLISVSDWKWWKTPWATFFLIWHILCSYYETETIFDILTRIASGMAKMPCGPGDNYRVLSTC